MSDKSSRVLFEGIVRSIDTILKYTEGFSQEQFSKDQKTRDAVLMQLMVLGETANRVPAESRKILPEVEWGRIITSRHIIAHEYNGIDYDVIWRIITHYLPELKQSIEAKKHLL
jgi:uncharacterized protein with HEPN domain